ncbi:Uncharacterized protein AC496_2129 [Pseudomonas savastanoi pv. glycinea]|uniref:Transcriptional regulator n=1 Tax=Pseudomonas savastanoi pv. glycinea TaxID=318 RepID=A0ABR5L3M0_PSESG|nr:Uncharacterized protein AC496_2129 [Pseudomonas savastanoi pv. glycinea]
MAALLRFTGIRGEAILAALRSYFIDGRKQVELCRVFNIKPSLLSRKVGDLNKIHTLAKDASKFYL